MQRNQCKPILQLWKDLRSMFPKKQFPRSSLPVEVISEIHIPGQIGFFKSNHLLVFIELHGACRVTKANATFSSKPWIDVRQVAACNSPEERVVQPSAVWVLI